MNYPIKRRKDAIMQPTYKQKFIAAALVGALVFACAAPMMKAQSQYDELAIHSM